MTTKPIFELLMKLTNDEIYFVVGGAYPLHALGLRKIDGLAVWISPDQWDKMLNLFEITSPITYPLSVEGYELPVTFYNEWPWYQALINEPRADLAFMDFWKAGDPIKGVDEAPAFGRVMPIWLVKKFKEYRNSVKDVNDIALLDSRNVQ